MIENRQMVIFDKYRRINAYHWRQCSDNLIRMDAYVKARYKIVLDCLGICISSNQARVLDVGCGDGALTSIIYKAGFRVYGIDVDRDGIRLAKEKFKENNLKAAFKVIEGYNYPFEDNFFEFAVCADVIEHVQEPLRMLGEIYRVLKPGGFLIISTPVRNANRPLGRNHIQEWTVREFEELCFDIFGNPMRTVISHHLFWYVLYTSKNQLIRKVSRLLINTLSFLGINVFFKNNR